MEILVPLPDGAPRPRAVLFDFDGTLSTLRCGWETVMAPLFREVLLAAGHGGEELAREVDEYIDASTGVQTIFQMQWLAERVRALGREALSPWDYKAEYNRRLMGTVAGRRDAVAGGQEPAEHYLVSGSRAFLEALHSRGVALFVASGTDRDDVRREAAILGLAGYFREIAGAPPGEASCPKEQVIQALLSGHGLQGMELAVVGDGRVEIALARAAGARALGVASDEARRSGVNGVKRARLAAAGAHAITGDFNDAEELLDWLGIWK